jgi:acyl carrier protein
VDGSRLQSDENLLDKIHRSRHDGKMTANNSNNGSSDVKEKIRAFILEYAADRGLKELKDDEPILTSNIIDSLGSFRMISFLEETFPLTIEDTDMVPENFQTLNDCETFVFGKIGMPNGDSEHSTTPAELATAG